MKSQLKPAKLITIIGDEAIKDKLISELKTVGMTGLACGVSSDGVLAFVNASYDMMNQEALVPLGAR
jgi:hypothetical protein